MNSLIVVFTIILSIQVFADNQCVTVCNVITHSKRDGCNAVVYKLDVQHSHIEVSNLSSLCHHAVDNATKTNAEVKEAIQNRSGRASQCPNGGGSWNVAYVTGEAVKSNCSDSNSKVTVMRQQARPVVIAQNGFARREFTELKEISGKVVNIDEIALCKKLSSDEKSKAGMKCKTSNNVVWERVGDTYKSGWKVTDGLIWIDSLTDKNSQTEASQKCVRLGGQLPSSTLFERYRDHYLIQEVINMDRKEYWTADKSK